MSLGACLSKLETGQIHEAGNVLALQSSAWKLKTTPVLPHLKAWVNVQNFKYAYETQIPS